MPDALSLKPSRGRPRDPAKREALLDAARRLFLDRGFNAVTMDQLHSAAGVSRMTLYTYYQDKTALLEAVIRRESERIVADHQGDGVNSRDLQADLQALGERLLRFLYDRQMIAFERLVSSMDPDLGRRLFAAGPGRARNLVMRLLERAQERGVLVRCDAAVATADFVGLIQGFARVEIAFDPRAAISPKVRRQRVKHGVKQFLRLYGAPPI